jgi:DNA-binding transcriptional LysR family regulator
MELHQLRGFVAVAEHLSVSKAAQMLHIAQPALSTKITLLENSLGAKLLVRNSQYVYLTPLGLVFLNYARLILHLCDEAKRNLEIDARAWNNGRLPGDSPVSRKDPFAANSTQTHPEPAKRP